MKNILTITVILILASILLVGCKEEPVLSTQLPPEATFTPTAPSVSDVTEPSATNPTETDPVPTEPPVTQPSEPQDTEPTDSPTTRPSKPSLTDPVDPDLPEIDPDAPGEHLPVLPLWSVPIENGFLALNGSNDVLCWDSGEFVRVSCSQGSITVEHAGEVYPLNYRWCQYNNLLHFEKCSDASEVVAMTASAVKGSAIYAEIHCGTQTSVYSYLLNAQTGEVTDPLAVLDPAIKERISNVEFSPDGKLAFISYNGHGKAILLDCSTGAILEEFNTDDTYNTVIGNFLEGNRILLSVTTANWSNRWKIYSMDTGEIEDCTYFLVPDRNTDDFYLRYISGTQIGVIGKNGVYLSDLTTQECVQLNLKNASYQTHFFHCADGNIGVIHENVVYVVDLDAGTMTPVLRIEDVAQ